MRLKKIFVSLWILMFSVTLGGCWDVKYLDELSIVIAMGMDTSEDQKIQVTVQVVVPSQVSLGAGKGGGGSSNSVTTYSETGQTVIEAMRKISAKASRELFFSHNQVLVIGEDLARKGITDLFEFIERDPAVRTDFYVLVANHAKASDVLKITTPIEKLPGIKIHNSVDNVEKRLGTAYSVKIKDIIENINSEKKQITMGSIEIIGDIKKGESTKNLEETKPASLLKLNGLAVFKDNKLIDFIYPKESRGAAWIQDKIKNAVINVPCTKKGNTAIEVIHSSTSMKAKFEQGQPLIVIRLEQEANIGETLCPDMDVSDKGTLNQLEKGADEQIKREVLETINKAKKWKADIFGFGDAVYKANPAYWKENKNNWEEIFSTIPVQVEADTEIKREGIRNKSYYKKDK